MGHARLVRRYADSVVLLLDADSAGQNAAIKSAEVFVSAGLKDLLSDIYFLIGLAILLQAGWRLIDLAHWLFEEFTVSLDETTVGRELKKLGYVKLTARPRHHAQDTEALEAFKKGAL